MIEQRRLKAFPSTPVCRERGLLFEVDLGEWQLFNRLLVTTANLKVIINYVNSLRKKAVQVPKQSSLR